MRGLEKGQETILIIAMVMMTIITFSGVISRYVFSSSIYWSEEVTRYLMIWMTFIGASLGIARGAHIKIDVTRLILPAKIADIFNQFSMVLCVFTGGLLLYATQAFLKIQIRRGQATPVLQIPMWVVQSVIIIFAVLTIINWSRILLQHRDKPRQTIQEADKE